MKARSNFMRRFAAVVGLTALAGVNSVYAADVFVEEPPAPAAPVELAPVNTWSGPYAGVTLGWGFGGRDDLPGVGEVETDGFTAHGFAGFNAQAGAFVYGVEGDVGYNGVEGTAAGVTTESGADGSLRARLGYAVTDDILLYGTGGVAAKRLEVSDAATSDTNTMVGWTAGAGIDAKVTEQVFGRAEYRYSDYGSDDFSLTGGTQSVDSREHRIGLGLGLKF
jgi:outer membrane immunogenic protein